LGTFGALAARYYSNSRSLQAFDSALESIQAEGTHPDTKELGQLLSVLGPIGESISHQISDSLVLDDHGVIEILHQRHSSDWQAYRNRLLQLIRKISASQAPGSREDWDILNDVADALDAQCTLLFRRMSGRN
jgi:hypothetical protein